MHAAPDILPRKLQTGMYVFVYFKRLFSQKKFIHLIIHHSSNEGDVLYWNNPSENMKHVHKGITVLLYHALTNKK
jgi:hypothetical protein